LLVRSGVVRICQNDSTCVELNPEYKVNPKLRKVSLKPLKRGSLQAPTATEVNTRRMHVIHAAIVRVMKATQECTHQQLVAALLAQVNAKFKPEVALIKQAVETLIMEGYIRRLDDDFARYAFVV